ncbi:MAG: 5'-nucleotidase C-terminal domain-containing protein [Gammaproteobacteria bacterium]|nr:5'-nucleotidase C-terminal domain-containing protein [Gammaproteobacteria bacterium]MDH3373069.1 5'-nucleotidase C-terminal domain-containing protein [Gammaproteobacteria bacterium]MDH3409039.1 5'-nucleotidase C-terminal domain-containing protein [Gammaproteobacteria bacterium]MDH3551052.1 5'-nucleotidase C-terminal domain-containing protein [Gammaproteobacteria bacterium]
MRILLVISLFIAGCAANPDLTPAESSGLTFIHLNDTYRLGAVEDGKRGGFGRVVTVIRELQAEGRDVRILHGGDFLYPSLESQLWNGLQMVDAFNYMDALAPMYVVIGNHELDRRTPEHLVNAVRASNFDWLGDNYRFVTGDSEVDAALQSAFTIDYAGKTIGFFALVLHADDGGNDRDYAPVDKDYLGNAKRVIEQLEARGVDAIIGVTHLHLWQDKEIAALRTEHPKLAFIVGGHEHEPEFSPLSDSSAAVMKGASNARVIWRIDMSFDANGQPRIEGQMLDMDSSVVPDADYTLLDNEWRGRLLDKFPFLEARVGEAAFPFDATEETIRNNETVWGNFIVDQMLTAFGEPADFAFINSGTLRIDDFISEDIAFEDIGRTFGFSSFLRYMTMTGAEFRQVMEAGFRGTGQSKGYFPQIAGFRVCVDRSRESGSRIVSLQVPVENGWQEIDTDAEYMVVVPDFLYRGGDGYQLPRDRPASRPGSELKYLVLDGIMRAQARGEAIGTPVDPANPRIEVYEAAVAHCFNGNSTLH